MKKGVNIFFAKKSSKAIDFFSNKKEKMKVPSSKTGGVRRIPATKKSKIKKKCKNICEYFYFSNNIYKYTCSDFRRENGAKNSGKLSARL